MSSLYRSFFLAAAVFWLVAAGAIWAPALAHASEPPLPGGWFPDPDHLDDLAGRLAAFSAESFARHSARGRARARRCVLERGTFICEHVELSVGDVTIRAERLEHRRTESGGNDVRAVEVRADVGLEANYIEYWRVESWRASDGQHALESVHARRGGVRLQIFRSASATLEPATGAVDFNGLHWSEESAGPPVLTVTRASFDGQQWHVRGFDISGLPPYVAAFEADTAGPVSGFLPSRVVWSHETVDLQSSYMIAPWGIAPQVVVAPGHWYGVGAGLVGQRDLGGRDEPGTLDLQIRWTPSTGEISPVAVGDATWGEPYTHTSASLEAMGDEAFWETERLARGALFRPWRLSRIGVSLSGPAHHFRLGVVHAEGLGAALGDELDDRRESLLGVQLELATTHELAHSVRADLGVEYRSFFDPEDGQHATTLRTGLERPFGSRGALFARPALRGWLQTGLGSQGPGLGVRTSVQLLASVDAGLGLRGRFSGVTHHVEPAVVVVREIAGFSRSSDASQPSPGRMLREPGWTLAGVRLDQSLDFGRSWSVGLPLAILYEGDGLESAVGRRPWGLASLRVEGFSVGNNNLDMTAYTACEQLCETVLWSAGAHLELGSAKLSYGAGDLQDATHRPLLWRSSIRDGWSLIEGFQGLEAAERRSSLTHLGEARWRGGRWGINGRVFWTTEHSDQQDDAVGVSVGNSYAFEELGWAVGVEAAWTNKAQRNRSQSDDWGLLVGLKHRR